MSNMEAQKQDDQKVRQAAALLFLQKDYELKINYLSAHFTRMWTRFNFFLVLESGLSAALWGWAKDKETFSGGASAFAWIGLITSICWYVMGAEDRYLVEAYRSQVEFIGAKVAEKIGLKEYMGSNYVHVGSQKVKVQFRIYQWRWDPISTTKLAAWFPLIVTLYWIGMLIWIKS